MPRRRHCLFEILGGFLVVLFVLLASPHASAQTGLTLRGDTATGESGDDITLTFRADGFWQITEGMGTIQWDPHVMDFVSAGDFGISAITAGTFSRIPEGMLTFDWSTNDVLGNTLPDGSILFSLTFNLRGSSGQSTSVVFNDAWTALHFESVENINLPFSSVSGTASIIPEPFAPTLLIVGLAGASLVALSRRMRRTG